jgi:hypothetical protein
VARRADLGLALARLEIGGDTAAGRDREERRRDEGAARAGQEAGGASFPCRQGL